ncbi:hypothetical protein [Nocardioides okcheonensis]|uniref:hypothetical protein n=1 Tax=Nocardioides okcheonensis TaxID=2894081 RepID=UPI001E3BE80B|nr:hypothetical protein [Nocardioides okcheonensis]UFN46095.1 hypothetical protein LN652_07810 [Nocardioides okcheonensis]
MTAAVLPLHMGALHPYEQALTLLLAFGPFVVLGVVLRRRSKELAAEEAGRTAPGPRVDEDAQA